MDNSKEDTFAERLERLFQEKTKPDGTLYSAADILEHTKGILTRVHLWKLRSGQAVNPNLKTIIALADAFGVPTSYFFESDKRKGELTENDQQEELRVLLRSFGMDRNEQKAVLLMVDAIKKAKK